MFPTWWSFASTDWLLLESCRWLLVERVVEIPEISKGIIRFFFLTKQIALHGNKRMKEKRSFILRQN